MSALKGRIHYAWFVMIGCCCLQAGALGLVLNSAGVFFGPICSELGFSQGGIAAYLTCYSWATCVGMLFVAKLFPKMDTRVTMTVCSAAVVVALGAMSFYTELWQWYVSGVIFGLFGSFVFVVPAPILIANWFHKKTGLATGVAMAFSGIGAAIFSPVLTALIEAFGWRTTYLIAAVIMAVMVLPWTAFVFRFSPDKLGMKPYGWEEGSSENSKIEGSLPGVPFKKALPTVAFVALLVLAGLCAFYAGYNNQWPNYAVNIGETAMFGATLISAAMVGNIVSKLVMGAVSDVIGVFPAAIVQLALVAVAMLLLAFSTNPIVIYIGVFAYGFQNNLVSVSTPMLIKECFGAKSYTEIFAFVRLGTGIIGGLGLSFVAVTFDMTGTYTLAFLIGVGISLLGIVCVLLAMKSRKTVQAKSWED